MPAGPSNPPRMDPLPSRALRDVRLAVVDVPAQAAPGSEIIATVSLANHSAYALDSTPPAPFHLAYRWYGQDGRALTLGEPARTLLWRRSRPQAHERYAVRVVAPDECGQFILRILAVQEHVRWYDGGNDELSCRVPVVVAEPPLADAAPLLRFEAKRSSQNGEDGILRELFVRLGVGPRLVVEFGVEDGAECNAAQWIRDYGWEALLIEADEMCFARLQQRYGANPRVRLLRRVVDAHNLPAIFRDAQIPEEFDLLSIDVDGNDYWLWRSLRGYCPTVVTVEYNPRYAPPQRWIMRYDPAHRWDGTSHYGASLTSLSELGEELGYALVGTDGNGVNAFFVRRERLASAALRALTPAEAYRPFAFARHPFRPGAHVAREVRLGPEPEEIADAPSSPHATREGVT